MSNESKAKEVRLRWGTLSEAARRTGKERATLSRAFKRRLPYALAAVLEVEKEADAKEKQAAQVFEQIKQLQK